MDAQPWTYNFGTGTGTHPTNSNSTSFFTGTPSGGGTYRVRTGSGGGTIVLANPGTALGTDTELQLQSTTGTSTNKFAVYDWGSPSSVGYLKAKIRTTSTGAGNLNISYGINTIGSDNNGYTGHYNNSVASLRVVYSAGSLSVVSRRTSGADNNITSSGIVKDGNNDIEIYVNNASSSTSYTRSGSNSLNAQSWDLWIDGTKLSPSGGWARAGTLSSGVNMTGFGFFAESSAGNAAFFYIDDLEYSNALPTTPTYTVTYNGNTNTGGTAPVDGSSPYISGATVTVLGQGTLVKSGYNFVDWDTQADGSGTNYSPAATFSMPAANTTLYAQWTPSATPTLTAGSLSSFGNVCINTTSTEHSFTLSGSNLDGSNVTISGNAAYTFATSSGGSFSNPLTLTAYNGTTPGTIYVLFNPTSATSYDGTITISGGADPDGTTTTVSGSGTNGTVAVTTVAATSITTTGASSGGNTLSTTCGTINAKGVVWGTSANPTVPSANSTNDGSGTGDYTSTITGLTANTLYNYRAYATNSNAVTNYGSNLTFTTVSLPATAATANTPTSNGFTAAWTAPTGQGAAAITYTVQIFSDAGLTAQVGGDITGISGTSTVINTLSPTTTYYYRVAVVNGGGTSTWANYTTGITTLVGPCFSEDFASIVTGNSTSTGGSSTAWGGNTNFPTGVQAFQAGGAVRIGSGSASGSITSMALTGVSGDVAVHFDVKGWTTVEGTGINVTLNGITELVTYTAVMAGSFEAKTVNFTSVPAGSTLIIATAGASGARRAFIDNIQLFCTPLAPEPEISISGNSNPITNGDATPSLTDHTGFGNADVTGGTVVRTYTIFNNGTADLVLNGSPALVNITGSSDFTLTSAPSTPVLAGQSTSFQITFDPSSTGLKTATLTIPNNDVSYSFSIEGTGVNNANSDIIANGSFPYSSNIDYTEDQAATITSTTHSLGVFGFTIRDGGASAADTDGLGTELNAITFNAVGIANIRSAALFDGNTMVNNAPTINVGGGTIAFSGLSGSAVTANNNATKNLTLRISYLTTVTDNEQLSFTIAAATASPSGSVFAIGNAGGAVSSTTGDRNRIEVTADRIGFVQQPTDTGISGTMSPAVTVEGKDVNNNRDLDYTGSISITSTGTLTGSPVASSATSGLASFGSLVHTVSETGRQLTATSTGLAFSNTATSSLFDITSIAYVNGDYRTIGSGSWVSNSASPAIWERLVAGVWTANNSPAYNSANAIYVQNGNTISSGGSFGTSVTLNIMSGGTFSCGHSSTAASIHVYDGGVLNINASLTVASGGTFEVDDNGTVNANFAYSNPTTSIWQGTENFHPNSNLVIQNWNDAQALFTTANITANTYNSFSAAFGNINVNSSVLGGNWVMLSSATSVNLCHGNFTLTNANGNTVRIGSSGVNTIIGGNLVKNATSTLDFCNSGTSSVTVNGTTTVNAGTLRVQSNTGGTTTVNFNGNVSLAGTSTLYINQNSGSSVVNVNMHGDFTAVSGTTITNTDTDGSFINFNGTALQSINSAVPFGGGIGINIASGANVQLVGNNLQLNGGSRFTVQTGGTFNFNFANDGTTALLVTQPGSPSGTNTFASEQASTLKITSPDGIVATVTANLGNVQLPVSNKTFNNTATFHYIGKANQVMGNAISTGSNGKVVIVELNSDALTLTPSNNIQISSGTTVDVIGGGRLDIRQGIFVETPTTMVSGSGRLVMTDGTFRSSVLSTTLPQLSGYSTYSLTGGTVELNGNGDQVLSGQPNGGYFNLAVTNAGNKTITSGFVIANNLNITAGTLDFANNSVDGNAGITMTGGRLRTSRVSASLPELDGIATPYSLTGGTIELYGTSATQQHSLRTRYGSPSQPISFFNVDLNASAANVQAGSDGANIVASTGGGFSVQGTFNVNSPACFRLSSTHIVTGSGSFNVNAGATLKYGGTIDASGATGNVQTSVRNFSSSASYGFVGNSSPQVAGTGLPTSVVNLYMDKADPSNLVQIGADITVNGTLQVYNGIASLGSNKVIIPATGSISGASALTGWVNGALQRHVAASTTNRTFEIGTAGTYLPVDIDYSNVTVAGNMTVSMNTPDHPQIASATTLNANMSINRYWNITQTGITMDSYSPTLSFASFDKDAGVSSGLLNAGLYNGITWSYPVIGVRTASTTQALNVTSNGAFVLAHSNTPPPINDSPAPNNPNLSSSNYVYPNCIGLEGTTVGATVNASTGERDVWYQFTAISNGVSIKVSSAAINAKVYLFNEAATVVLSSEDLTSSGNEILNFGGLTAGVNYRIAVSSVGETDGTFTLCVQQLRSPNCGTLPPYGLCSAFKSSVTGATTTTYSFTQGMTTTTVTSANPITLGQTSLQLAYGGTYQVGLTANYVLQNGLGQNETIQVSNAAACSITLDAHPAIETKSIQRCANGAVLYRTSYLQALPVGATICGVTGYRVEFTPVSNCAGDNPQNLETFSKTITSPTASISLNYVFSDLAPLANYPHIGYWSVRWRPRFGALEGNYGNAHIIAVNGTSITPPGMSIESSDESNGLMNNSHIEASIYPNPNNGDMVNLNMTGITTPDVFVRIMDGMGKVVFTNRYTVDDSLNTLVSFNKSLAAGLYMVEFTTGNEVITQRMMVAK